MTDAVVPRTTTASVAATPNRWIPALVFLATLLVASVLLFARVSATTIELAGTFTGVGFVSAREQPLTRPVRVVALGVAGARDVQLPEGVPSSTGATAVRIAVEDTTAAMRSRVRPDISG